MRITQINQCANQYRMKKKIGLYVFMQYEGYMTCRYYTINVNFQLTQCYQIIIYPSQGTSAPALPSEVQS